MFLWEQQKSDSEMSVTPVCHQAVQHMALHSSCLQLSRNSQTRKGKDTCDCQSESMATTI